jgi:hypothetical protein
MEGDGREKGKGTRMRFTSSPRGALEGKKNAFYIIIITV